MGFLTEFVIVGERFEDVDGYRSCALVVGDSDSDKMWPTLVRVASPCEIHVMWRKVSLGDLGQYSRLGQYEEMLLALVWFDALELCMGIDTTIHQSQLLIEYIMRIK